MKSNTFILASFISLSLVTATQKHPKSLVNLGLMAIDYIDCPFPYFPIPYGCWCGISIPFPPAHDPIDNFDAQCKIHDYCYEESYTEGCDIWDAYVWDYDWKIENGDILCDEGQDVCQKKICECDRGVIKALAQESANSGCPDGNPGCPDSL